VAEQDTLSDPFQDGHPAKARKGLKLGWLFYYGMRPWHAWILRYPKELRADQFLKVLRYGSEEIASFEAELKDFVVDIASKVTKYVHTMYRSPGAIDRDQAILLYLLIRLHRPKIIVETGVGQGVSTAFILKGVHDNEEGQLFSIDLPFYEESEHNRLRPIPDGISLIPKGLQPGWMIPDYLRDRWELLQGDSRDLLIPLINRIDRINLFLQDDLHTYKHMLWEFRTVWPHISEDGLLLSHDWEKNPSLCQFAWENALPLIKCCRIGCISKLYALYMKEDGFG
jgi:hypothetical protein